MSVSYLDTKFKKTKNPFSKVLLLSFLPICISTNVTQTLLPPSLSPPPPPPFKHVDQIITSLPSYYYFDFPLLSANPTFPNLRLFRLFVCSSSHERPRFWRRRKFDPNLPPPTTRAPLKPAWDSTSLKQVQLLQISLMKESKTGYFLFFSKVEFVKSQIFADKMRRVHFSPSSSFSSSFIFSLSPSIWQEENRRRRARTMFSFPQYLPSNLLELSCLLFFPRKRKLLK